MSVNGVDTEGTQQFKNLYLYQGIIGVQHWRGREREGREIEREQVVNTVCTKQAMHFTGLFRP